MLKLDPPDWSYFGAAWGVVAVGLGFFVMSSYQLVGGALVILGLILVLFSLRPTFRSLPVVRSLHERRVLRAKLAEQKRLEAERSAERDRLIPELAAWDPFCSAASSMVHHLDNLCYSAAFSLEEWNAFIEKRERSITLAPDLHEPERSMALQMIEPFADIDRENYKLIRNEAAHHLRDWLEKRRIRYYHERRAVGLPELPQGG